MDNAFQIKKIRKLKGEDSLIGRTVLFGFLLRLVLLVLIITLFTNWCKPYFITDDIKYEKLAWLYIQSANSIFDINNLNSITAGYKQIFWPAVVCFLSYTFKSIYAARFVNIIISALCIKKIYELTYSISSDKKSAITASKLFAYLPVTALTCCFNIKDIFITYAVLYVFNLYVKINMNIKTQIKEWILSILLLVGTYLSRGGVVEMLLIFLAFYVLNKYIKEKKYTLLLLTLIFFGIVFYFIKDSIMGAFEDKISYSEYGWEETGIASAIRMRSLTDFYKLPLSYIFATLQPMTNLYTFGSFTWGNVVSFLNLSIYPVVVGNLLYFVKKKDCFIFWLSTLVMYLAVSTLSLGIFRHYLFLLPVEIINYSLLKKDQTAMDKYFVYIGTAGLFVTVMFYSLL